ncbi:lysophospholipid acyltransferase family protein [Flavobacterium sp. RHBU_3]|uniref:lysophospholipid acyltransferase family protein n=1 Tax=Flavobacterium sp. RHBU_3 TaxID=3391184 RepID=UPI003985385D
MLITKEQFSEATGLCKIPLPWLPSYLMKVLKINELNSVVKEAGDLEGAAFSSHILQKIGVKVHVEDTGLQNIPLDGAFIAIANHPYGGIESLAILSTIAEMRPDTLYMGNFLLKQIPNLEKSIIAVNPFENIKNASSISGLKSTFQTLKEGTPVAIFPAGEVSSYDFKTKKITDREWHPAVGKIICKAGVPILPIYFHGNNGLFFSLLKSIHPMLQTSKLISELFNKRGHVLKMTIGKPILLPAEDTKNFNPSVLQQLRDNLYALKNQE